MFLALIEKVLKRVRKFVTLIGINDQVCQKNVILYQKGISHITQGEEQRIFILYDMSGN